MHVFVICTLRTSVVLLLRFRSKPKPKPCGDIMSNGFYQNNVSEEITLKNEVRSPFRFGRKPCYARCQTL